MPLVERFDAAALNYGMGAGRGFDRTKPGVATGKASSPELASLAARYVNMTDEAMAAQVDCPVFGTEFAADFWADVRALAASVLAQAEGNPRK